MGHCACSLGVYYLIREIGNIHTPTHFLSAEDLKSGVLNPGHTVPSLEEL